MKLNTHIAQPNHWDFAVYVDRRRRRHKQQHTMLKRRTKTHFAQIKTVRYCLDCVMSKVKKIDLLS